MSSGSGYPYLIASSCRDNYRTKIENARDGALKNFKQMDFENADVRDQMEAHVSLIVGYCGYLLRELDEIDLE